MKISVENLNLQAGNLREENQKKFQNTQFSAAQLELSTLEISFQQALTDAIAAEVAAASRYSTFSQNGVGSFAAAQEPPPPKDPAAAATQYVELAEGIHFDELCRPVQEMVIATRHIEDHQTRETWQHILAGANRDMEEAMASVRPDGYAPIVPLPSPAPSAAPYALDDGGHTYGPAPKPSAPAPVDDEEAEAVKRAFEANEGVQTARQEASREPDSVRRAHGHFEAGILRSLTQELRGSPTDTLKKTLGVLNDKRTNFLFKGLDTLRATLRADSVAGNPNSFFFDQKEKINVQPRPASGRSFTV